MCGAKLHQYQSQEDRENRGRIDTPILPCLLHWPLTLSHIIAADTKKTNDSHVGNMGLVEVCVGFRVMKGSCGLMGHK
ncbi:unnamed protein product, partial [Pleuronectes platessa]